jgi:hypothetical protein
MNSPFGVSMSTSGQLARSDPQQIQTTNNYLDEQTVKNILQNPNDVGTQNISVKQPMCAGGKIQLPTINKKDVISIRNDTTETDGNIPMINTINKMSMNNIILEDDLCYNRCPNGEDPRPDFLSGQYTCLIPATVTYSVIPGTDAEIDPNNPKLDQLDKINYEKGYTVSCQSTDLNNIGLDGQQTGNLNNLMFGIPILKKSGLYENPTKPNVIRTDDFLVGGNQKWFCKRPVFGSPPINQVQSKYQFLNNTVVSQADSSLLKSAISICDKPNWTTDDPIPEGCSVKTTKDGSYTLSVSSPYEAAVNQIQTTKTLINANEKSDDLSDKGLGGIIETNKTEYFYETLVSPKDENSSDASSRAVSQGLIGAYATNANIESVMTNYLSDNIPMESPIQVSVANTNSQMNIVTSTTQIPVPKTETHAIPIDGTIQTVKPINQSVSSQVPMADPNSCKRHEDIMWKDVNNRLSPDVILTKTHDNIGICGYSMNYKGESIKVINDTPVYTEKDIENASNNLRKSRNIMLCGINREFNVCRNNLNNGAAIVGGIGSSSSSNIDRDNDKLYGGGVNSNNYAFRCTNLERTLNTLLGDDQRIQLDNLCKEKPDGDFVFTESNRENAMIPFGMPGGGQMVDVSRGSSAIPE